MHAAATRGQRDEECLGLGMYQPIHGSAPDIAGKGIANPLEMVLTTAMLLRHSCGLEEEAQAVERAVMDVIDAGLRTADIAAPGEATKGTREDRKSVVEGKGVSVRVDLGGRRSINKKREKNKQYRTQHNQ